MRTYRQVEKEEKNENLQNNFINLHLKKDFFKRIVKIFFGKNF